MSLILSMLMLGASRNVRAAPCDRFLAAGDVWTWSDEGVRLRVRRTLTAANYVEAILLRHQTTQDDLENALRQSLVDAFDRAQVALRRDGAKDEALAALRRVEAAVPTALTAARAEYRATLDARVHAEAFDPETFEVAQARLPLARATLEVADRARRRVGRGPREAPFAAATVRAGGHDSGRRHSGNSAVPLTSEAVLGSAPCSTSVSASSSWSASSR